MDNYGWITIIDPRIIFHPYLLGPFVDPQIIDPQICWCNFQISCAKEMDWLCDDRKMAWKRTNNLLNDSNQANQRILMCVYMWILYIYINTNYIYLYIILFAYRHTIFQTYRQKIHAKIKQLLLFRTQLQPDSCPQNCSPGTSSTSMLHQQIDSQKANENELVVWNILAKLEHFPKKRGENSEKMFELLPPRKLADMDWFWGPQYLQTGREPQISPNKKITQNKQDLNSRIFFYYQQKMKHWAAFLLCQTKLGLTLLHQVSSCSPPVSFPKKMDGS